MWAIVTRAGGVETFTADRGGRVRWTGLAASCDDCGCEVHTGRRPAETDSALKARLGGKRAKLSGRALACANCGHEYAVHEEDDI